MERIIDILCLYTEQILGVIGILFMLAFEAYLFLSNKKTLAKKRRCTEKTIGTVIHAENTYHRILHQGDDDDRHDHLNYSYTLEYEVGGYTYTRKGTSNYAWVGEKKKVYYNPENPQESQLGGTGLAIWVSYVTMAFFVFAIIVLIRYVVLVPIDKSDLDMEEDFEYEFDIEENESEQEDILQNLDTVIYGDTVLFSQDQADQVCIALMPSVLGQSRLYYYIPEGEDQQRLQEYMETLPSERSPYEGKMKEMKSVGWQIAYEDQFYLVYEGGYLWDAYTDETGELMEYFEQATELCDYIQDMLQEKLGYYSFNPADIENIVSAKLDIYSETTSDILYSQTITDEETLQLFEEWFRNAKYVSGNRGINGACLELTLSDGETVCLVLATDSCATFGINGVYYDYSPTDHWDSREFFKYFDEIPWNWD